MYYREFVITGSKQNTSQLGPLKTRKARKDVFIAIKEEENIIVCTTSC
jgi:hypothetical protein